MSLDSQLARPRTRKAIHVAELLLIQADGDVAAAWREALLDFGMSGVRAVNDADGAIATIRSSRPHGIVMALSSPAESYALIARLAAGEAGDLGDVPVVLVTSQATRTAAIAASNAGFDAVLPFPLSPRLIYRRMGSLMQRARRAVRQRNALPPAGPVPADDASAG